MDARKADGPRVGYLRWDRLLPLLRERLGDDATRPEMAEHLGIGYVTFWRMTSGDKRHVASEQSVTAVLAAFPDQTFEDLFDTDGVPARRNRPAKAPTGPEPLYTVKQVAQAWGCSEYLVYKWIRNREIRAISIGVGRAKLRIPASVYDAHLKATNKGKTNAA